MEQRALEVELISAKELKDVNVFTKMSVYAVAWVQIDNSHGQQIIKTPVVRDCGTEPTWNNNNNNNNNNSIKFNLDECLLQGNRLTVVFNLVCRRTLRDKQIGHAVVPVKELFETMASADKSPMTVVAYQVVRPSRRPQGQLHFSYQFSDKVAVELPHGYEYPAQPQTGYGYPAAAPYAGYGYPAPPPYPEYGYPPVQRPQQERKSRFGLGLGAGLFGGILGGLLIGTMAGAAGGGCGGCGGGCGGCGGGCGGCGGGCGG